MVYVFLANGFEEIEAICVVDILRRCGAAVQTVAVENSLSVTGAHEIAVTADLALDAVKLSEASALVLPGGMPGADRLQKSEGLLTLLQKASRAETIIAAICAAPKVLGAAGLLSGRRAVCYPGFESALTGASLCTEPVVRDGHIITARGPAAAPAFAFAIAEALGAATDKVRTGMLYN